jgi:tetratricopeptide (TPR) repeat protein
MSNTNNQRLKPKAKSNLGNNINLGVANHLAVILKQCLSLYNTGQFEPAKAKLEEVLRVHPDHFDSLQILGMIFTQTKQWDMALNAFSRALEIDNTNASLYINRGNVLLEMECLNDALSCFECAIDLENYNHIAHYNKGIVLHKLKLFEDSIANYDRAIKIKPDFAIAYSNRGNVLLELRRFEDALENFNEAIALKKDYFEAHTDRGNVLTELNRYKEALDSYDRAITIRNDYALAHSNRGIVFLKLKHFDDAIACFDKAIELKPDYAEAYSNLGNVFRELNLYQDAIACFSKAIELRPDYAQAFSNLGSVFTTLMLLDEALVALDKAIELNNDHSEAYLNRGCLFFKRYCFEEALADFDKAINLRSDYAQAYVNRGAVLHDLKRFNEAISNLDTAIQLQKDDAQAHHNKSHSLLLTGNLEEGFLEYEWRWQEQINNKQISQRTFKQPLWLGKDSVDGKSVLLYSEQGYGDTIQFCRYARLVKNLGAKVLLEVPKPLITLLESLDGVDMLIEEGKTSQDFDYRCPLMSLPLAFKTQLNTIPNPNSYLKSNSKKLEFWAQQLGAKTLPRIGLVWSGNKNHGNDRNRSISLAEMLAYLPPNFEYVSLQKDFREKDKVVLSNSNIKQFGEQFNDFSDTAALCDLMDLVISVDTSVAHLACAMGKRTWILLPYNPDWRWLLDRTDSPWYESATLFRQSKDMRYEPVMEQIVKDLINFGNN